MLYAGGPVVAKNPIPIPFYTVLINALSSMLKREEKYFGVTNDI